MPFEIGNAYGNVGGSHIHSDHIIRLGVQLQQERLPPAAGHADPGFPHQSQLHQPCRIAGYGGGVEPRKLRDFRPGDGSFGADNLENG
ncbi:hypothetical protein D3C75_1234110 [compost metagenome]